jgi:hypothetical protein
MKLRKFKLHSRITDIYKHDVMQTGISKMEPNVNCLVEQRQAKVPY